MMMTIQLYIVFITSLYATYSAANKDTQLEKNISISHYNLKDSNLQNIIDLSPRNHVQSVSIISEDQSNRFNHSGYRSAFSTGNNIDYLMKQMKDVTSKSVEHFKSQPRLNATSMTTEVLKVLKVGLTDEGDKLDDESEATPEKFTSYASKKDDVKLEKRKQLLENQNPLDPESEAEAVKEESITYASKKNYVKLCNEAKIQLLRNHFMENNVDSWSRKENGFSNDAIVLPTIKADRVKKETKANLQFRNSKKSGKNLWNHSAFREVISFLEELFDILWLEAILLTHIIILILVLAKSRPEVIAITLISFISLDVCLLLYFGTNVMWIGMKRSSELILLIVFLISTEAGSTNLTETLVILFFYLMLNVGFATYVTNNALLKLSKFFVELYDLLK